MNDVEQALLRRKLLKIVMGGLGFLGICVLLIAVLSMFSGGSLPGAVNSAIKQVQLEQEKLESERRRGQ